MSVGNSSSSSGKDRAQTRLPPCPFRFGTEDFDIADGGVASFLEHREIMDVSALHDYDITNLRQREKITASYKGLAARVR
jgi:hypothetical protein